MSEKECEICNNDICMNNITNKLLHLCTIDTEKHKCPKCGFKRAYKLYFPYGDFSGMYQCWLCKHQW